MSLRIRNRGTNSSLYSLAPVCFTKQNLEAVAGAQAPYGVLGGTVAAIGGSSSGTSYGDYVVCPGNGTLTAVGLFVTNADGAAWENSPAVASGKIAIFQKMGSGETDIYANGVTFKLGDKLYSDANGYLTNVESTNKQVIAICTKLPTSADPWLGFDMCI